MWGEHVVYSSTTAVEIDDKLNRKHHISWCNHFQIKRNYLQAKLLPPKQCKYLQAELEAIRQAAAVFKLNKKSDPAKYIKILVDSQVTLAGLSGNSIKSETVRRTMQELLALGFDIPRLTLAWIKAQVGYEGNELANHTAKRGALELHMSIKTDIPISKTEIANTLKEQI